jgi:shikimate dehydrogenase
MHRFDSVAGLFGVIGWPLDQSLSPALHNWGFAELGLPFVYCAWPTPPAALPAFTVSLRSLPIRGVSVTLPHKEGIMPYLDRLTEEARHTGAVNTLFWREGELWGENTDVAGFIAPLKGMRRVPASALILGAGGASLACIHGLRAWGVPSISVAARRWEALEELRRRRGVIPVAWEERGEVQAELVINATPVGMRGKNEAASPLPATGLGSWQTVYDLIYNPVRTVLLREAAAAGCDTVSGLDMFLEQARAQFELWTGRSFERDKARRLLLDRLQQ